MIIEDKQAKAFMQKVDSSAPFWQELRDPNRPVVNMGGEEAVPRFLYNLMITKRDVNLYLKGIKPHRGWRISDVKAYFGLTGGKQKIADAINLLHSEFFDEFREQGYIRPRETL